MKTLVIIIGMFCCLNSLAQHTPLNQLVKIKFPNGTEKLSHKQLQSYLVRKKGFNQNREWFPKGDVYRIKNMVLQLNGAAISRPNRLEDTKRGFDEMDRWNNGDLPAANSREIKTINNYKVLILHRQGIDFASYSFFSVNNLNTKVLNGMLEYDKFDTSSRNIAATTLDRVLKSMKFK